jgi:ATP-dependent Clp protease protease subunit
MIHQPSGGAQGQASDIRIAAEHIIRMRERLNKILAERCKQPLEKVALDTERDNWMTVEEAISYGIVDQVMDKRV